MLLSFALWCYRRRSFWKDAVDFEHQTWKHTSSVRVFDGWHNVKVFAICPQHCGRFFISTSTPDWALRLANRLLRDPSPPVFSYYSGLSLGEGFSHLIDVVAQLEFAVLAVVSFFQALSKCFLDTTGCGSRMKPCIPYLAAMSTPVISLVKTIIVCAISDGSGYGMATVVMTREDMWSTVWLAVTLESVAQLLLFSMESETASVFTTEGATCFVQGGKKPFLAQSLLSAVPRLSNSPLWTSVWRAVPSICNVLIYSLYLLTFILQVLIFEHGSNVSPNLRGI